MASGPKRTDAIQSWFALRLKGVISVSRELVAEPLGGPTCVLGEGPVWDADLQELAWVDILGHSFHRAVLDDGGNLGTVASVNVPADLGAVVRVIDGGWLLAMGQGFSFSSDEGEIVQLAQPESETNGSVRMNDAYTDCRGRWWAGSMGYGDDGRGSLFRVDLRGRVTRMLFGLRMANGLGWTGDSDTMVLNDTRAATMTAYHYDLDAGELGPGRVLVGEPHRFRPDGLCVDEADTIWSANWDGGEVRHYDLSGRQLEGITVPVRRVSSCCFAGPNRDLMIITTGQIAGYPESQAGQLFIARPGVTGAATPRFRGRLPTAV